MSPVETKMALPFQPDLEPLIATPGNPSIIQIKRHHGRETYIARCSPDDTFGTVHRTWTTIELSSLEEREMFARVSETAGNETLVFSLVTGRRERIPLSLPEIGADFQLEFMHFNVSTKKARKLRRLQQPR